jgi:hypothetical protein
VRAYRSRARDTRLRTESYPTAPWKKMSVYCRTIASPVSGPSGLYH